VNSRAEAEWYIAVDATSIAMKHGLVIAGWPVVNLIMASAFAAASKSITLESLIAAVPEYVPKKYVDANISAIKEAYEEVLSKIK
ncbi:MAG: 2-oxoacid:acceptor oxidoreductase family protein, partial [Pyrobaculum sp.]